jgi:hypothetical protein
MIRVVRRQRPGYQHDMQLTLWHLDRVHRWLGKRASSQALTRHGAQHLRGVCGIICNTGQTGESHVSLGFHVLTLWKSGYKQEGGSACTRFHPRHAGLEVSNSALAPLPGRFKRAKIPWYPGPR